MNSKVYEQGSDTRLLRDVLGCFATGVCIVTALTQDGKPVGLTVNSFTSVSLDPPLVLACIARTSTSIDTLQTCEHFSINLLQTDQEEISNVFAKRGSDRFSEVIWSAGENGSPLIDQSLAIIECTQHAVHDGGDHIILVGKVVTAKFDPDKDPLLYYGGQYRHLNPIR